MRASMVVLVVLLALLTLFTMQNPDVVTVRFLGFEWKTLLLVVVAAAFATGVFGTCLAALPGCYRRRGDARAAGKRIRDLEAEAKALKEEIDLLKRRIEGPARPPELPKTGGTG